MRSKAGSGRGRPRGSHSRVDTKILEYLVKLSGKHGIDPTKLFSAIVDAWKNGKTTCQELIIKLRMKKKGHAIFLITQSHMVVAQFPIPEHILEDTNPFGRFEYVS
jgi:hypothetical protein